MKQILNFPSDNKRIFFKRFLPALLLMLIVLGGLQSIFYYSQIKEIIIKAKSEEKKKVILQKEKIISTFEFINNDLLSMANATTVQNYLSHPDKQTRKILQEDLIRFLHYKGFYDQARIIDYDGNEVLRVNYSNGNPNIVLQDLLQSKNHRYYFSNSIPLKKDEIYISPLDLNLENKKIEIPFKPTIRFCTSLFNRKGESAGIFVLNYLGKNLIDELLKDPAISPGQTFVTNPEGYYMVHPVKEKEWGFMLENRKVYTLFNEWADASKIIYNNLDGQLFFNGELITFTTVYPFCINKFDPNPKQTPSSIDKECKEDYWKIISIIPNIQMQKFYRSTKKLHLIISIIVLVLSLFFAYIFSRIYTLKQISIDKLTRSEQNLQIANITKDKFISILAHDLKNPVASIMGYTHFMLEAYHKISEDEKILYLESIHKASMNLADLIDDILTWALSQSGKIKREPKMINLNDTIWDAVRSIGAQASQKGIDIIVAGKKNIEVFADPEMVKTVVRNLISNAIKFSNRDRDIQIKMEKGEQFTTTHIIDFGIGIPKKEQENLFQLARKVQTKGTENETGTGLGLILCREFVEKNNGKIWLESAVGKGTTVRFTLPNKE